MNEFVDISFNFMLVTLTYKENVKKVLRSVMTQLDKLS